MDDLEIATITTNKGYAAKEFMIEPQGLIAKPGRSKLSFIVTRDDEPLGMIHTKLFRLTDTHKIAITTSSEEVMFIMIALVLFIDDREPSFFSIFKKLDWFTP